MGVVIDVNNLQSAIDEILQDYGDKVFRATEEGLDEAANILVVNLKSETPKGETKKLGRGWKTEKKYKLKRYVHNTKMVDGKDGKIPLINIIEYSPTKGKPFVKSTFNSSVNAMANAVVGNIKNIGGK